jgi:hypothetical protein
MYGGDEIRTDSSGIAELIIEDGGNVSIYVNGVTAYSGSKSNLPSTLTYRKS